MTEPIVLTPIGVVCGGRSQICEDHWAAVVARLLQDRGVQDRAATDGLSEFSHVEVVSHFHQETRVRLLGPGCNTGGALVAATPNGMFGVFGAVRSTIRWRLAVSSRC